MMPLSFVAILGGMTTLIGSSTNLLVSNSLKTYANVEIGFFDITLPGMVIAFSGFVFIIVFSKFLLTDRSPMTNKLIEDAKQKVLFLDNLGYTQPLKRKDIKVLGKEAMGMFLVGADSFREGNYIT